MAIDNSKPNSGDQKEKTTARPMVRTRGEIKDLEGVTWDYMLNQLKIPQPELIRLHVAKYPAKIDGSAGFLVRFFDFDKSREKALTVKDYESLTEHPEMIVYEGYYVVGKGGEVVIKKRESTGESFLSERMKNGEITDVGLEMQKSNARKWLGRVGTFMMMGGFVLVLIVIVVLLILFSSVLKGC